MASFLEKFFDKEKLSEITVKDPRQVFSDILRQASGSTMTRNVKFDIFYQIIAFKGVVDGVGTSTLVANTALAIADLGLTVCVIDTSILYPTQDILLKTDYENVEVDQRLDWFDMPFTKRSPLHVSKINGNISILSFYGKDRGITDILSTNDNASLVEIALTELHNKFDIILIDSCAELTTINTTAVQMSNKVIQVWNDTPSVMNCIDNFITNQVTLACSLDKMRYVVYSKINPDIIGNLDGILKQYRLNKLAETYLSKDVNLILCMSKPLYQFTSTDEDVVKYTDAVIRIALHILNVKLEDTPMGTFTANDIMDGNVAGTVYSKFRQQSQFMPEIATNMQQANMQMQQQWGITPQGMPMQQNMQIQPQNMQQANMQMQQSDVQIQRFDNVPVQQQGSSANMQNTNIGLMQGTPMQNNQVNTMQETVVQNNQQVQQQQNTNIQSNTSDVNINMNSNVGMMQQSVVHRNANNQKVDNNQDVMQQSNPNMSIDDVFEQLRVSPDAQNKILNPNQEGFMQTTNYGGAKKNNKNMR